MNTPTAIASVQPREKTHQSAPGGIDWCAGNSPQLIVFRRFLCFAVIFLAAARTADRPTRPAHFSPCRLGSPDRPVQQDRRDRRDPPDRQDLPPASQARQDRRAQLDRLDLQVRQVRPAQRVRLVRLVRLVLPAGPGQLVRLVRLVRLVLPAIPAQLALLVRLVQQVRPARSHRRQPSPTLLRLPRWRMLSPPSTICSRRCARRGCSQAERREALRLRHLQK